MDPIFILGRAFGHILNKAVPIGPVFDGLLRRRRAWRERNMYKGLSFEQGLALGILREVANERTGMPLADAEKTCRELGIAEWRITSAMHVVCKPDIS